MTGPRLEVCYSPALLPSVQQDCDRNVVVVDILRASTAICTAFGFGVASITPFISDQEVLDKKEKGWLVAGESDGVKLPFADFGNSPVEFRDQDLKGKEIAYKTTNGTKAIHLGKKYGRVCVASFVNLEAVCGWLNRDQKDVLILCAGYKDAFSLEDAIFAGAMSDLLVNAYGFLPDDDAVPGSVSLWRQTAPRLMENISRSSHYLRLLGIESRQNLRYCIYPEKFHVIPVMEGERLVDHKILIKT